MVGGVWKKQREGFLGMLNGERRARSKGPGWVIILGFVVYLWVLYCLKGVVVGEGGDLGDIERGFGDSLSDMMLKAPVYGEMDKLAKAMRGLQEKGLVDEVKEVGDYIAEHRMGAEREKRMRAAEREMRFAAAGIGLSVVCAAAAIRSYGLEPPWYINAFDGHEGEYAGFLVSKLGVEGVAKVVELFSGNRLSPRVKTWLALAISVGGPGLDKLGLVDFSGVPGQVVDSLESLGLVTVGVAVFLGKELQKQFVGWGLGRIEKNMEGEEDVGVEAEVNMPESVMAEGGVGAE